MRALNIPTSEFISPRRPLSGYVEEIRIWWLTNAGLLAIWSRSARFAVL
jgi:hypothetical protein